MSGSRAPHCAVTKPRTRSRTDDPTSAPHIQRTWRHRRTTTIGAVVLAHGEGGCVTDGDGRRYLDSLAGYSPGASFVV